MSTTTTTTTAFQAYGPTEVTSTNLVASTHAQSKSDVETSLNFIKPPKDGEQAYIYAREPPSGIPPLNFNLVGSNVMIHDARGKEGSFTLDKSGFSFVNHPSEEKDFLDEGLIKSSYYKEVEEMLKKETNASRVLVFDHTVRYDQSLETLFKLAYLIERLNCIDATMISAKQTTTCIGDHR